MTNDDELWDDVSTSTSVSEADEEREAEYREHAREEAEAREAAKSDDAETKKEAEETLEKLEKLKKALRLTVPNPLTSLWLGKVEKKEHGETETFEGLRGYSSEDLAMLARKDIAIGASKRVFVDAADELLMLAGFGPKLDETNPAAAEEVAESVEEALENTETAARDVEYIGFPLAKVALLATGFPFPAPGAVAKFKAAVWAAKVANWGWGAYKSGKNFGWWGDKSPGVLGLFASDEIIRGAKKKALTFAGESYGAYAGKSAEIAASGSAELIGGVIAEVLAGGIAEMKAGVSAEVVGGAEAALKSVWGTAEVIGREVEIGTRKPGWKWGQKATEHLALTSTHALELSVGPATPAGPGVTTASISMDEHEGSVTVNATDTLIESALTVLQGSATFAVGGGEVTAVVPVIDLPERVYQEAIEAAETARDEAFAAIDAGPVNGRIALRVAAVDAHFAARRAAMQAYRANVVAVAGTDQQFAVKVTSDGVMLTAPLAKVELSSDGTVRVSQSSGASLELSNGAVKLVSAQAMTIQAAGNTWTFGPLGLTGPGIAGA